MDKRPIFVIITADNCGHCGIFKSQVWPTLEPVLKEQNKVLTVAISIPKMTEPLPSEHLGMAIPNDLRRYANWFPTFILCTPGSWYSGGTLEAFVYNGKFTDDIMKPVRGGPPHTKDNLVNWINSTISSNPSFTTPFIKPSTNRTTSSNSSNPGYIPLRSPSSSSSQEMVLRQPLIPPPQPISQPQTQNKKVPTYGTMRFVPNVF